VTKGLINPLSWRKFNISTVLSVHKKEITNFIYRSKKTHKKLNNIDRTLHQSKLYTDYERKALKMRMRRDQRMREN
jgi:hypothetical protein